MTPATVRGATLVVGGAALIGLLEGDVLPYYWLPLLTGIVYLAAAVAGRSRGPLWGPALVTTTGGLAVALWIRDGRAVADFQFTALAVMALGTGAVLAAVMNQAGYAISAMSVALPVLLFGAFLLAEEQSVSRVAGSASFYGGLLVVWGLVELALSRRSATSNP